MNGKSFSYKITFGLSLCALWQIYSVPVEKNFIYTCLKSVLLQFLQYLDMEKFRRNDTELYQFTVSIIRVGRLGSSHKIGPMSYSKLGLCKEQRILKEADHALHFHPLRGVGYPGTA